jgi:hypothetical protein
MDLVKDSEERLCQTLHYGCAKWNCIFRVERVLAKLQKIGQVPCQGLDIGLVDDLLTK